MLCDIQQHALFGCTLKMYNSQIMRLLRRVNSQGARPRLSVAYLQFVQSAREVQIKFEVLQDASERVND